MMGSTRLFILCLVISLEKVASLINNGFWCTCMHTLRLPTVCTYVNTRSLINMIVRNCGNYYYADSVLLYRVQVDLVALQAKKEPKATE